jgi:hypothetical protein
MQIPLLNRRRNATYLLFSFLPGNCLAEVSSRLVAVLAWLCSHDTRNLFWVVLTTICNIVISRTMIEL